MPAFLHSDRSLAVRLAAVPDTAAARAIVEEALDSGEWWAQGIVRLCDALAAIPRFDDALVVTLAATEECLSELEAAPGLSLAQRQRLTRARQRREIAACEGRPPSWAAALLEDALTLPAVADASSAEEVLVFDVLWRLAIPQGPGNPKTQTYRMNAALAVLDAPHCLTEAHLILLLAVYAGVGAEGVVSALCQHPRVALSFLDRALAVVEGTWPSVDGKPVAVRGSMREHLARYLARQPELHASPAWRARWWRAIAPCGSRQGPWAWYHAESPRTAAVRDPLLAMAAQPNAPDRYLAFRVWVMSVGRGGGWPRDLARFEQAIDQDMATMMLHSTDAEVRRLGITALAQAPVPEARWLSVPPPSDDAVWPILLPTVHERLAHNLEDMARWNSSVRDGPSDLSALLASVQHELSAEGWRTVCTAAVDATRTARALQMARAHLATIVPEDGVPENVVAPTAVSTAVPAAERPTRHVPVTR